ncbi:hypothetical protein M9Y10_009545 [Tritrichomonas musculus]|uniref:Uncharacterized protein n=1 Tax=Tritrichomonas musculus TaxID=1915356 RepID=A0ABR2IQ62_9EUKA
MSYTLPTQGLHARPCTFIDTNVTPVLTAQTETILEMRRDLLNGPCHSISNRFCPSPCSRPCNSSQSYDRLVTNQDRPLQYPFIHADIHPGQLPVSTVIANSQYTNGFSSGVDYRRAHARNSRW